MLFSLLKSNIPATTHIECLTYNAQTTQQQKQMLHEAPRYRTENVSQHWDPEGNRVVVRRPKGCLAHEVENSKLMLHFLNEKFLLY